MDFEVPSAIATWVPVTKQPTPPPDAVQTLLALLQNEPSGQSQCSVPPQPSSRTQRSPLRRGGQVRGAQPQTLSTPPPPHVWGPRHVAPQSIWRPQLSLTVPHLPAQVVAGSSDRQT